MMGKTIIIQDDQAKYIEANKLDLNTLIQNELDERMKKGRVVIGLDDSKVKKLKEETRNPHSRPTPHIGAAKIHDTPNKSDVVIKPPGWKAQTPNYRNPLRTDISIKVVAKDQDYPVKEPEPNITMPKDIIHGAWALEEKLVILPVTERITSPAKIRDFSQIISI